MTCSKCTSGFCLVVSWNSSGQEHDINTTQWRWSTGAMAAVVQLWARLVSSLHQRTEQRGPREKEVVHLLEQYFLDTGLSHQVSYEQGMNIEIQVLIGKWCIIPYIFSKLLTSNCYVNYWGILQFDIQEPHVNTTLNFLQILIQHSTSTSGFPTVPIMPQRPESGMACYWFIITGAQAYWVFQWWPFLTFRY